MSSDAQTAQARSSRAAAFRRTHRLARIAIAAALLTATVATQAQPALSKIESAEQAHSAILAEKRTLEALAPRIVQLKQQVNQHRQAVQQQLSVVHSQRQKRDAAQAKVNEIDEYHFLLGLPDALDEKIAALEPGYKIAIQKHEDMRLISGGNPPPLDPAVALLGDWLKQAKVVRDTIRANKDKITPPTFIPSGRTPLEYRAEVAEELAAHAARLKPLEQELKRRVATLSESVKFWERTTQSAVNASARYFQMLALLHSRFEPLHLRELKVSGGYPGQPGYGRVFYHVVYSEPDDLKVLDAQIATLLKHAREVQAHVNEAQALFENAEKRFIAVSDQWQEKFAQNLDLKSRAYQVQFALELADVAIASLADRGAPATLLFEVGYRAYEAVGKDFGIEEPKVKRDLIEYRQRMAKMLRRQPNPSPAITPEINDLLWQVERSAYYTARWQSLIEPSNLLISGDQLDEVIKGTWGNAASTLFEKWSKDLAAGAIDAERGSIRRLLAAAMLNPGLTWGQYKHLTADSGLMPKLDQLSETMRRSLPDCGDNVMNKFKDLKSWKDIGKGFAIGAVVTAAKDPARDLLVRDEWSKVIQELAVLDIKWLIRRAEYQAASDFRQQALQQLLSYEAAIGKLFAQRDRTARKRTMSIQVNRPLAIGDALRIEAVFSDPASQEPTFTIGGHAHAATVEGNIAHAAVLNSHFPLLAGDVELKVHASGWFDGDPSSVARYRFSDEAAGAAPNIWADLEAAPNPPHQLSFKEPLVKIINPSPNRTYTPGDWIDLEYKLPGMLAFQGVRVTADELGDAPLERRLPENSAEGRTQFKALLNATRLLLVIPSGDGEPARNTLVAETRKFNVPPVPIRPASQSQFTKVFQSDLPTRGQWFVPPTSAIPEGMGRVLLERRDAASQLIGTHVAIYRAGSKQNVFGGWGAYADLPPGTYDIVFGYTPPIIVRGHVVEVGRTAAVNVGGYGRLELHTSDALGQAMPAHVIVSGAGAKQAIYRGWQRTVDVPPGAYDLVFDHVVDIEAKNVNVTAGKLTRVETGGYGRFQLDAVDGLNQPIKPHRSIYRAGEKEAVYGGWDAVVDLPPGTYKVVYDYIIDIEFNNVQLNAGTVTPLTASGLGRVVANSVDGAGRPKTVHVEVVPVGGEDAIYGGWERDLDLPPGNWEIRWRVGDEDRKAIVNVTPRTSTTVNIRVP